MMNVGVETSIGRVRETNEDSFWVGDGLLIVCDGMGGHQAGEVASKLAVDYIRGFKFLLSDPEEEIRQAILGAHKEIVDAAKTDPALHGMGTTITMALCIPQAEGADVIFGHVGDSRAYGYSQGELFRITNDHSLVGELARQGTLSPEEAEQHPQRHVLSQALGLGVVEVEVQRRFFSPGSRILLCTDGLTDVLSDEQIKEHLEGAHPQEVAHRLVQLANTLSGRDNITVIVAQVS